jgi:hypothetical protein
MMETFIKKIKVSALKSMKRIGDGSRRFQQIVYGKSLETVSRIYSKANKTTDKMKHMRDSIRQKH